MLGIQLLFSMIAVFVRIELLYSSIRRLPRKRANGVDVFEGSPIRYNSFPLNTSTPLISSIERKLTSGATSE